MDGSSGRPSESGSTVAAPLRTVATRELVVPRSMPTARRCSCGAGDMPGSEIWRSAIWPLLDLLVRCVDFVIQPVEEHELPHQLRGGGIVLFGVERVADLPLQAFLLQ